MNTKTKIRVGIVLSVLAIGITAAGLGTSAPATPPPAANKVSVSGASVEILNTPVTSILGGSSFEETTKTILESTIKTSAPTDLILSVSLECALWTTISTTGNSQASSEAKVVVWIEVDGVPVPVSSEDASGGKVVFCDRLHRQTTSGFADENATIEQFQRTRTANAFNWVLVDAGSGVHTVEVIASLEGTTSDMATSQAGVGQRTLVIEPIKLAPGTKI